MLDVQQALTFDDVLLVPGYSEVLPAIPSCPRGSPAKSI